MSNIDDLVDPTDLDTWLEGKQTKFEERMVKLILTRFNLAHNFSGLRQELRNATGDKDASLTFTWFHAAYPSFPVRLCAQQSVFSHKLSITDLYKRFTTTTMFKAFADMKEAIPEFEQFHSYGLIFPWAGMGYAILHNASIIETEARFTRVINKRIVYLDILTDFIESVKQRWSP